MNVLPKLENSENTEKPAHLCEFCKKRFAKLNTFLTHLCVKKQRYNDINQPGSRIGYSAYVKFIEITSKRTPDTQKEFINNNLYLPFTKFGNYAAALDPIYLDLYIEYLIRNEIKATDWVLENTYLLFVSRMLYTEPATSAVDRTITEMISWADKQVVPFHNFFWAISPDLAAPMIKHGKISPWVLYLSKTGNYLMERFTNAHASSIKRAVDPAKWAEKFKKQQKDVEYIKSLLIQLGL